MSNSSDWLARKLAGARPPAAPVYATPPQQVGIPAAYQQPAVSGYAPPPPPGSPPGITAEEAQAIAGVSPEVAKMMLAAARSGGSRKAKAAMQDCPECGGAMMTAKKVMGGAEREFEHCFACGYPVVQSSSNQGPANLARPDGKAHMARSPGTDHVVEVVTERGIERMHTNFQRR